MARHGKSRGARTARSLEHLVTADAVIIALHKITQTHRSCSRLAQPILVIRDPAKNHAPI
jgi:hypothetical protein